MIQLLFALLAGVLTIGAPCILPILPILLGASIGQRSKARPAFIALGFVVTFSLVGLFLSTLITRFHFDQEILRYIAVFGFLIFGAFMVWPTIFKALTAHMSGIISKAGQTASVAGKGNAGGFVLGMLLGVIWTPCAGPVLGSILTLIATQDNLGNASALLIAYAVGAGIPMLIIGYGSQAVTTRIRSIAQYADILQRIFGIVIILFALPCAGLDLVIQAKSSTYSGFTLL